MVAQNNFLQDVPASVDHMFDSFNGTHMCSHMETSLIFHIKKLAGPSMFQSTQEQPFSGG